MTKIVVAAMLLLAAPALAGDGDEARGDWLKQYYAHITAYCIAKAEAPDAAAPGEARAQAWARQRALVLERSVKHLVFPASGEPVPVPECSAPALVALVRCARNPEPAAGCQAPPLRAVASQAEAVLADAGHQAEALLRSTAAR